LYLAKGAHGYVAPKHVQRTSDVSAGPTRTLLRFASLITIFVAGYNISQPLQVNADWSWWVAITCLSWLGIFLLATYLQFRNVYTFANAYVGALLVFHLGITIPDAFGWFRDIAWSEGDFAKWLERSGWYTAMALGCFGIGYSFAVRKQEIRKSDKYTDDRVASFGLARVYWAGTGLLLASIVFLFIAITAFGNLLDYSRVDFFRGGSDTRGLGTFLIVFPTALMLLVLGAKTRVQKILGWGLALVGFPVLILSGYRSMALFPLLTGIILWVKTGRRVPPWLAVALLVGTGIAISTVGIVRAYGPYKDLTLATLQEAYQKARLTDVLELGATGGVLANVLKQTPSIDPYRYGGTYINIAIDAIPNVLPKKSNQVGNIKTNTQELTTLTPGRWITYRVAPDKFERGEGIGFSAIGDPYINFGIGGVIVFFLVVGFLLGRLDRINLLAYPNALFLSCILIWPFLKTVRNDFGVFLKPVVFLIIILVIWRILAAPFWRPTLPKQQRTGVLRRAANV